MSTMADNTNPFSKKSVGNESTEPVIEVSEESKLQELNAIQQKQINALIEKTDILYKAANKHKLQKLMQEKPGPSEYRISFYEGKLITSWKMTKDYVRVGRSGVEEDQMVQITFSDGKTKSLPYRDFGLFLDQEIVTADSTKTDSDGNESIQFIYKGEEYSLDKTFVNH